MTIQPQPHFVLVPLMAQGHMIPMVDIARLLASRGASVSFITTPVNAARIKPVIDSIKHSGLHITFVELHFPCTECGLPEGIENIDLIVSANSFRAFFEATHLLRDPLLQYLQNNHLPTPTCIISDYCHPWTMHVSRALNIPRFIFHGPSSFFMLGSHILKKHGIYDSVTDENEPFLLPDILPYQLTVTKAQVPGFFRHPGWDDFRAIGDEAEATCDGVLLNSFDELEPVFIEKFREIIQKPVWAIGPLSLYNKDFTSQASRGNKASIDEHEVLGWLESKRAKSVIYFSFGSLARSRPAQLMELGTGLEQSGYPFIWVIKNVEVTGEVENWLEDFMVRNADKGLVIKGWAPQVVILSHPSVGGFVTHCGWNSSLEAISAGVPLITWPHFADQFINEKLIVEVLRVGITIGVTKPSNYTTERDEVVVTSSAMKEAVEKLMDGGVEGEEMRERARKLGDDARKAMEGGSSYHNLSRFLKYVLDKEETKQ